MKAVLLSIQPKWCELIASGIKTVEIRKTKPKIETPFKCYIYCSKGKRRLLDIMKDGDENFGKIYHGKPVFITTPESCYAIGNGYEQKVIGEFICDNIFNCRDINMDGTCLTVAEYLKYTKGHKGIVWGWHISDLVIYDKPKELRKFHLPCDPECYGMCEYGCIRAIKRPPLSWCYVEEEE